MKKSLLKSLALAGLVLSFAACDPSVSSSIDDLPPEPEVMSVAAAIEWDSEDGKTVNDGKLVTIKEAVLNNKFGNSIIVQQTEGDTIDGINAVEVITAEPVAFGWKDVLNVTGTVGDIDGRPVIKEAVVSYAVSEAESKGTGAVYGYGALSRAGFDALANRGKSGMLMWGGLVQFATLPDTIVAGQASEFKVVFPGEKLEADNPIAIPVTVPAMTENEAAIVKAFFADKNAGKEGTTPDPVVVGDAFEICAPLHWSGDTVGFVFGSFGPQLHDGFEEITNVYADWADLGLEELFLSPMPDLSKEGTSIYNYVVNESFINDDTPPGWLEGLLITAYTDEADDDFDILLDRILADTQLEWALEEEESGYAGIVGYVDEDATEASTIIELENGGSYINIWLGGEVAIVDWEAVIEIFEDAAAAYLEEESYTTSLPEFADPLAEGFQVTDYLTGEEPGEGQFQITAITEPGSTYDYEAVLVAAGFELLGLDESGYIHYENKASGEYVILVDLIDDLGNMIIVVFVD